MFFPVKMTKSKFRKVKIGIDIYVLQVRWPKSLYIFGKRCENAKKSVIFVYFPLIFINSKMTILHGGALERSQRLFCCIHELDVEDFFARTLKRITIATIILIN